MFATEIVIKKVFLNREKAQEKHFLRTQLELSLPST